MLQYAYRTGHVGSRAGMTVEERDAGLFERPLVDLLSGNDLEKAVWENEAEECNKGRADFAEECVAGSRFVSVHGGQTGSPDPDAVQSERSALDANQ